MINSIVTGIISLITYLVSLILVPIDNVLLNLMPDLSNAFTSIGEFLNLLSDGIGWAVSITGLSSNALSLIVAFYIFKLTAPLTFYMLKLAVDWFRTLKV